MNIAINIKNLNYAYGKYVVLKDVSFCVKSGDFFIIIGPNGSGKSTLMRLISGIIRSKKGQLEVFGMPMQGYTRKALARTIAFVPQMVMVEFPFTVNEVVLMGRSPHQGILGLEKREDLEIAKQAIAFTDLEHLSHRKLTQLSGGELQRVYIAKAICQEPRIMLLDEPTASLDIAHQIRVMDLMEKLKEERGVTIVMVSHDVNLAAMYGQNLLLLKEGQIVRSGFPEKVLTYETLEHAYGCTLLVDDSPLGKFPRVTLVPQRVLRNMKHI